MNSSVTPLPELVKDLPLDLQGEVRDFIEFLLRKRRRKHPGTLRQDWAGLLREYRTQYTAMELQRNALHWRSD